MINSFANTKIKYILTILLSAVLFFASPDSYCVTQNKSIELTFAKSTDILKVSYLYFNVLKVYNSSPKIVSGSVTFNCPENWKLISFPSNTLTINPGDTLNIPVRLSPSASSVGGITYMLSGTFKTTNAQYTTSTSILLPSVSKWEFSMTRNSIYFTENNTNAPFQVRLQNKGNTNELIKLNIKIGKLYILNNSESNLFTEFVQLPAFKDTTISYSVIRQKKLTPAEKDRYENNWNESSIKVTVSTEAEEKSSSLIVRKLSSEFLNQRSENSSPLNIDYQVYNLMSNQEARSNIRLYGSILFPKNAEIQYFTGIQNLSFKANDPRFNLDRQLLYSFQYTDAKNRIQIGYNINSGSLHTINGRGIDGLHKFDSKTKMTYALIQNPYSNSLGGTLGLSSSIKSISLNTGVTYEKNLSGNYTAASALVGTGFTLFKHHTFMLHVLGSQANYIQPTTLDTTVRGFSYKADYSMKYNKFDLRVSGMSSANNFIRNSGLQHIFLDSKYTLNDNMRLTLYANRQYYATTRYPYNFYNPSNYNSSDYARLTLSVGGGSVMYQFGPNYVGSMRQYNNPLTGFKSEYQTFQPGVWASTTFKLDGFRSITPNITISNLRFIYTTNDPASKNYSMLKNIYYSVGLNYYDNNWRLNAYYSSGSTSDLYRSIQIDEQPTVSRSIQLRPSYENFFFNRKVKLSAFLNYAYYMPSQRENLSLNLKYDHFLNKGWTAYVSGFIFSNIRVDKDFGRIGTKDLNFIVGVCKSFNFQQPRQKYYNLKSLFFNDLDGNKIKSKNEPPVSNILVNIEKDKSLSAGQSGIPEVELVSDVNGQISFENLPKDTYKLSFTPLANLQSLYFLDGPQQTYYNDRSRILYVPLAESYKIKGKIILIRDANSTEGKIEVSGVRISATGKNGETYTVLTDNFGMFMLNVPNAGIYTVRVNNVFGEQFSISNDEVNIQFVQNKTISLEFTFNEKVRGIQFDNGGELYNFNSLTKADDTVVTEEESKVVVQGPILVSKQPQVVTMKQALITKQRSFSTVEPVFKNKQVYAIQVGAVKSYRSPSYYKNTYKLTDEVLYLEKNGEFKYYIGRFDSIAPAKTRIAQLAIPAFFAVAVDYSLLKRELIKKVQQTYSIQLDALKTYKDPAYYKTKFNLKDEVLITNVNGEYKYFVGNYKTIEEAKADISKLGVVGFPAVVDGLKLNKAKPDVKIKSPQFTIQLIDLEKYSDPEFYKKLKYELLYTEKDGAFKYFTGDYKSIEEAEADILKLGISGTAVVADRSQLKKMNK